MPRASTLLRPAARRARGVALLLVMVVLLLVATLATEIALTARTHFELAEHSMNDFMLRSVVEGRREILKAALAYDLSKDDKTDTEDDEWAWKNHQKLSSWGEALEPSDEGGEVGNAEGQAVRYRNRDVHIEAWCEDESGKINLRALAKPEDDPVHKMTKEALVRLVDIYRDKWTRLDVSDSDATAMVDELVDWLHESADTEDNPMPAVKKNRGRLLTIDDLLRVPGGHWTLERLYDVRDPDEMTDGEFVRTVRIEEQDPDAEPDTELDSTWERQNGVRGLARYITVWMETGDDPAFQINVNTAPAVVLRAFLGDESDEAAEAVVKQRREGGNQDGTDAGTAPAGDEPAGGWFKSKEDLVKTLKEADYDPAQHPQVDKLASFASSVFSLRIVASVLSTTREGEEDDGTREIRAAIQVREVVQRVGKAGEAATFLSLYAERRRDPIFSESQ